MHIRLGLSCAIAATSLVGCSTLGISNHSLDYKNSPEIPALTYPSNINARSATPLYPAPSIEHDALKNAPDYENKRGNRFVLPRPEILAQGAVANNNSNEQNPHVGRPLLLSDSEDSPLLRIEGPSSTIWQYTQATISTLNYSIIAQGKDGYESTIKVGEDSYVLRLSFFAGRSYDLQLFQLNNQAADANKAKDILTQIYQNWPMNS